MILDLMLPGKLDGLDVCRAIRRDAALASLPIIMLTARVEETDRLIGLELGADDYVSKPFSPRRSWPGSKPVLRRLKITQSLQKNHSGTDGGPGQNATSQ
jgi:two-component system alkaline phosphatase synthesis response regulator PhoP